MAIGAPRQGPHVQLNTTLVSLELNSNSIDYDGAKALAEAIQENNSLTSLYIRCTLHDVLKTRRPLWCPLHMPRLWGGLHQYTATVQQSSICVQRTIDGRLSQYAVIAASGCWGVGTGSVASC